MSKLERVRSEIFSEVERNREEILAKIDRNQNDQGDALFGELCSTRDSFYRENRDLWEKVRDLESRLNYIQDKLKLYKPYNYGVEGDVCHRV